MCSLVNSEEENVYKKHYNIMRILSHTFVHVPMSKNVNVSTTNNRNAKTGVDQCQNTFKMYCAYR